MATYGTKTVVNDTSVIQVYLDAEGTPHRLNPGESKTISYIISNASAGGGESIWTEGTDEISYAFDSGETVKFKKGDVDTDTTVLVLQKDNDDVFIWPSDTKKGIKANTVSP